LENIGNIIEGVLKGDKRSIARAITIIEDGLPESDRLTSALEPYIGRAKIIGVTGPTGSGKSTLIHKIVKVFRSEGLKVGVIAIDPTSPFTGGAFLGDRIRMQDLTLDNGVFIRSMATRGGLGGIAESTIDAIKVLDASGIDIIIVESVGAGQLDVRISDVAHTTIVVLAPGFGDEIQAIKAGIMEIADIFIVNKADRENADQTVLHILSVIEGSQSDWNPPIIKTVAITGEGIKELVDAIKKHWSLSKEEKQKVYARKIEAKLKEAIKREAANKAIKLLIKHDYYKESLKMVLDGKMTIEEAARKLVGRLIKNA